MARFKRALDLLKRLGKAPGQTIESGRVGFRGIPASETAARLLKLAATRRKLAAVGPASARKQNTAAAERLERQAQSEQKKAEIEHKQRQQQQEQQRQRKQEQQQRQRKQEQQQRPERPRTPERPQPIMPLEREGVPNPQSLSDADYQKFFGTARDVSPTQLRDYGIVLRGPTPLNHEGRLRRTGKVCGHWAMYAYLINSGPEPTLGIQFRSGFRCWYPGTSEADYHAIVNAESGSYYVWDYLMGKPYTSF